MSKKEFFNIKEKIKSRINSAVKFALDAELPMSSIENELKDVYKTNENKDVQPIEKTQSLRFIDAISEGLSIAMKRDEKVILLGQDIAEYGGVFKVTKGLFEKYPERVINTPIIESGVLGASMGLALEGYKPIILARYTSGRKFYIKENSGNEPENKKTENSGHPLFMKVLETFDCEIIR